MSSHRGDSALGPDKPDWLILIPTEFEWGFIADSLSSISGAVVEICGFGPIIPAAKTVQLIRQYCPRRVLLLGIAGSYDPSLKIGEASVFDHVSCYGVGVGNGSTFRTAGKMGWLQWPDDNPERSIGESIQLSQTTAPINFHRRRLLTVCSAAENRQDVADRQLWFPDAAAEDMEGFAVAAACQLCDVPATIVRGISNQAGDRDKKYWQIEHAMNSAVSISQQIMGRQS
jgi:futalosine hydrolase